MVEVGIRIRGTGFAWHGVAFVVGILRVCDTEL